MYFHSYASTVKDKRIKVSMIYNKLYYLTFEKKNFYCAIQKTPINVFKRILLPLPNSNSPENGYHYYDFTHDR